jgi:hypothetical protein
MKIISALSMVWHLIRRLFGGRNQGRPGDRGRYRISGARADTIATPDGPLRGMLVPITLANGTPGHLFIPTRQPGDQQAVYIRDEQGLHPIQLQPNVSRAEMTKAAAIVETRAASTTHTKRSWEKEVLIIGGSAAGGAAIGAVAGGKKGAPSAPLPEAWAG